MGGVFRALYNRPVMPYRKLLYLGVSLFTPCPLCGIYGLPWAYI
nr:MAG TPA: restriction alleviation protein [Caudoviricetes sp.]